MQFDSASSIQLDKAIRALEKRSEDNPAVITAMKVRKLTTLEEVQEKRNILLSYPSPRGHVAVEAIKQCDRMIENMTRPAPLFTSKIKRLHWKINAIGIESKAHAQSIVDGEIVLKTIGWWSPDITVEPAVEVAAEYIAKCEALGIDKVDTTFF